MLRRLSYKQSALLIAVCILIQIISLASFGLNVYANSANISLEFYNGDFGASVSSISMNFRITNNGSSQISLSDIKLRYYFTDDGVSPITVFIDYANNNGRGINNDVTYTIKDINSSGANKYIEFGFNAQAGSLEPNTSVLMRARAYQSEYKQSFTQTNDYSFCQSNNDFAAWNKVTGYLNGVLFSGTEPVMYSPTPSLSTPTPQISPTPVATPSSVPTYQATPTPSGFETPVNWDGKAVPNGDFESGSVFWSFYCDSLSGANATNLIHSEPSGNKMSKTSITNAGSNHWAIQLKHDGIVLENLKTYRLTFDAKSTVPRNIRVSLQNATSSMIEYFGKIVEVEPKMKTYTCEFTFNSTTGTNVAIVFEMGKIGTETDKAHDIVLDNVHIEKIASPSVSPVPSEDPQGAGITASRSSVYEAELGEEVDITLSQSGEIALEGRMDTEKEIVLVLDNSGVLNSYVEDILSPLDFGIYSNHNLTVQGKDASINGSVHANDVFTSTADSISISQTCSAASFHITSKNVNINEYKNITIPIEMPNFHSKLIDDAMRNSMVFRPEDYFLSWFPQPMPGQEDIFIFYNLIAGRFEIFGAGTLVINSSMYFMGNVLISLTNTNNVGEGFIVADGNIIIQGQNLYPNGPNDKLYVYSIGGNIEFQTSNSTINGIAYAPGNPANPNSGKIFFSGDKNTINGSIAANELDFFAGGLVVNHTEGQFDTVEEKYIDKSTYLKLVKDAAKNFVDKFAGSKTKMAVIQYSDSANDNDFKKYDLSLPDKGAALKETIDKIKPGTSGLSNMGDGMRRAYHILNGPPPKGQISKYIVVITGSVPNRWTAVDNKKNEPKTDNGRADFIKADNESYNSLDYAKDMGRIITSKGINLVFIDFSEEDIGDVLKEIAAESGAKPLEGTDRHYYKANNFLELLDILNNMTLKIYYDVVLDKVLYEEILPQGVLLVEAPEWISTESVPMGGVNRIKLTGEINNIPFTFTGTGYSFVVESFKIKVKFLKPGTIVFDGADSRLRYNFNYVDGAGNIHSKSVDKHFDDMTVNVTMKVDIN